MLGLRCAKFLHDSVCDGATPDECALGRSFLARIRLLNCDDCLIITLHSPRLPLCVVPLCMNLLTWWGFAPAGEGDH